MITTTSILTNKSRFFEISQLYYAPAAVINNKNVSNFYGFLSFIDNKDQTVLEGFVDETDIIVKCAVNKGSDIIQVLNRRSLSDFFKGQKIQPTVKTELNGEIIRNQAFPDEAVVTYLDDEFLELTASTPATETYIGDITFRGINQNTLLTIKPTPDIINNISKEENAYNKYMLFVNVDPNDANGRTYIKSIVGYSYNKETKTGTLRVETPFDDSGTITKDSKFRIFSTNLKPNIPIDSDKYVKLVHKNMYYMKKLTSDDFSPVIHRIKWESGKIYSYYRDDIDIYSKSIKYRTSDDFSTGTIPCYTNDGQAFELNSYNLNAVPAPTFDAGIDIAPKYYFYAMNSFYQVFKCLWNNNGGKSTVEPYFIPGNFDDATNIFYSAADGYKWKYMYTISGNKVKKFLDSQYMPVVVQDAVDMKYNAFGCGGIETINVLTEGSGYHDINYHITVVIDGDGSGAEAAVQVNRTTGKIKNVVIKNPGKNYTFANISFSAAQGSGATAFATISPIAGSGSNAIAELGCDKIMISADFNNEEDIKLPTNMELRQFGVIVNPQSESSRPDPASDENYISCNMIRVSPGYNYFRRGEKVFQKQGTTIIYSAICADHDLATNKLMVVNEIGTYKIGSPLYGEISGTQRSMQEFLSSEIIPYSGDIIHVQNFEEVQMSADSTSLFKVVINY